MFSETLSSSKIRRSRRHHKLEELLNVDFERLLGEEKQVNGSPKLIHAPAVCSNYIPIQIAADGARENEFKESELCRDRDATLSLPPFRGLGEAAQWLGISLSTIQRIVKRGELATVRVGARQKIPLSDLQRYAVALLAGNNESRSENLKIINGV